MTPVCDFCSAPDMRWSYPARDFTTPTEVVIDGIPLDHGSLGGWGACPACHALISRGDRDRLALRSAKRLQRKLAHEGRGVPPSLREILPSIRRLHDNFWSNREGTPVPADPSSRDATQ